MRDHEHEAARATAKKYEWEGEPCSRSTYFRRMRLSKRRGRKATTVMITGKMTTKMDINHERVETFVMLADNMSRGEQNENVELRLPRKVLGAIASALRGAGY